MSDRSAGLIRLGGQQGVAGRSSTWQVQTLGGVRDVRWDQLIAGLQDGTYSGIESVRRADGDWGPLFGRPMYREVFAGEHEPRDHAKARAADRIARLRRLEWASGGATSLALGLALPVLTGGTTQQLALLSALALGVVWGLIRLRRVVHVHELATLAERCVPPVLPPPPLEVDWAQLAADDAARVAGEVP